ncbi:uncharacterized protein LOC144207492 [Stigmatopora nigra]
MLAKWQELSNFVEKRDHDKLASGHVLFYSEDICAHHFQNILKASLAEPRLSSAKTSKKLDLGYHYMLLFDQITVRNKRRNLEATKHCDTPSQPWPQEKKKNA